MSSSPDFKAANPELFEGRERKRILVPVLPTEAEEEIRVEVPTRFRREERLPTEEEGEEAGRRIKWLKSYVERAYHQPDWQCFELALVAAIVHCYFVDYPIWFFIVGPPSTLKTTAIEGLEGLQKTVMLGSATGNAFLSGFSKKKDGKVDKQNSLLLRIGKEGIVVVPEFGALIANPLHAKEISNQFRAIYDGHCNKTVGALKEDVDWKGKLTVVMGMTEKMEWMWQGDAGMGDRFVTLRLREEIDPESVAMAAMENTSKKADHKANIQRMFSRIVEPHGEGLPVCLLAAMPLELKKKIGSLSTMVAYLRTATISDKSKGEVYRPFGREGTGRLSQTLGQVASGRAALYRRGEVNDDDIGLVRRIALDTVPWDRRAIIEEMALRGGASIVAKTLFDSCRRKWKLINRMHFQTVVKELESFDLLEVDEDNEWMGSEIGWSEKGMGMMERAGLLSKELKVCDNKKGE